MFKREGALCFIYFIFDKFSKDVKFMIYSSDADTSTLFCKKDDGHNAKENEANKSKADETKRNQPQLVFL